MNSSTALHAKAAIVLCAIAVSGAAAAQQKTKVAIVAEPKESIGTRLVFEAREAVRRSEGMQLVSSREDAEIRVHLVTMAPSVANSEWVSYSAAYALRNPARPTTSIFFSNYAGVCGSDVVASCAQNIVAVADALSVSYRAGFKEDK